MKKRHQRRDSRPTGSSPSDVGRAAAAGDNSDGDAGVQKLLAWYRNRFPAFHEVASEEERAAFATLSMTLLYLVMGAGMRVTTKSAAERARIERGLALARAQFKELSTYLKNSPAYRLMPLAQRDEMLHSMLTEPIDDLQPEQN